MAPPLANPTGTSGYLFVELLEKYTLADIKNIEAIALANEKLDQGRLPTDPLLGTGRCATALASLCFSTIEQVGLILRNDLNSTTIRNALKKEGTTNAESFFNFFASHGLPSVARGEILSVYSLFRNKITHNLFPRYSLGVSLDSHNPLNKIVISVAGKYSLNVNFLSNYVRHSIPLLKNILGHAGHSATIMLVDRNAQIIDSEELRAVVDRYRGDPLVQPYFTRWMPGITF